MAVWMMVLGQVSPDLKTTDLSLTLRSVPLDLAFLAPTPGRPDPLPPPPPRSGYTWRSDAARYSPERWRLAPQPDEAVCWAYPLANEEDLVGSIKVILWSDVVRFVGPMDHFGLWAELAAPEHSDIRNGWMAVVAAIFRALGAPQAVWSSEWCGMHAEDVATFDEVTTFVEANPHLRAPELENLKAAQYFLQPIA